MENIFQKSISVEPDIAHFKLDLQYINSVIVTALVKSKGFCSVAHLVRLLISFAVLHLALKEVADFS